jgi:DNA-binding protein H-NS
MSVDLNSMSRDELAELSRAIDKRMVELDQERRRQALDEMSAIAKKHGLSLNDVMPAGKGAKRRAAAPKYRHPENPEVTWSGRGRRPSWVNEALEKGRSLQDLAI